MVALLAGYYVQDFAFTCKVDGQLISPYMTNNLLTICFSFLLGVVFVFVPSIRTGTPFGVFYVQKWHAEKTLEGYPLVGLTRSQVTERWGEPLACFKYEAGESWLYKGLWVEFNDSSLCTSVEIQTHWW